MREKKKAIKKETVMQGMAMEEETEEPGCKYGNGVARICVWGGAPGRCHPVHFPGSPEADQIQWGGG